MERLKLFRNYQYQQLQDLHHDRNVDKCPEKESLNIGSGSEVAIVDGDCKSTIDSHLYSNNEKKDSVKNRLFSLQDGNFTTTLVQSTSNTGIEEFHNPHEKKAHCMQEANYDFLGENNTNSLGKKAQVQEDVEFDESDEKVSHSMRKFSYDFLEENIAESWKEKAAVEKEIGGQGEHFKFDIPTDVIPYQLTESSQQSHNGINEISSELGYKKIINNLHEYSSSSKWLPDSKSRTRNSISESVYQETKFPEATVASMFSRDALGIESDEQLHEESTSSNSKAFDVKNDRFHSRQIKLESQHPSNKISCKKHLYERNLFEDEGDPFQDIDLPEDIKITKWNWSACCEWILLIILVGGLIYSMLDIQMQKLQLWGLELWRWMVLIIIMVFGRFLSNWLIRIIIFLIERNFLLKKKVLYFVYALKGDVRNCMWLIFVLLTWNILFNIDLQDGTNIFFYISKALQCFLIAASLIVVKTFLVKILASNFHMDTYFERIRDSLFDQYVLETLSKPPLHKIQVGLHNNLTNFHHEGDVLSYSIDNLESISNRLDDKRDVKFKQDGAVVINVDGLCKPSSVNVSAWSMKKLINLVKYYEITTLIENFDKEVSSGDDPTLETEITTEYKAKVAAKQIFKNVVKSGCKFITKEDLLRFMNKKEASQTFLLFDGASESKIISPRALKDYVINVYKERRALASTLSDTKTAVNKLHGIINVFLSILIIILWLLMLGIATTKFIVFISSQLLVVVFIFGNTCRNIFEAIIFLFIVHPFDVGDRCVIDGNQLVVEEMNILTTVFLGELNAKIWYPNCILATKPIQNFYRSPEMSESFEFFVHSSTSAEKIAHLKDMISKYIAIKSQHWKPLFNMLIMDLDNAGKMKLSLNLTHTMNFQNFDEKITRRSDLLWEMKRHLEALGIEYHLPALKVNIQNFDTILNTIHS